MKSFGFEMPLVFSARVELSADSRRRHPRWGCRRRRGILGPDLPVSEEVVLRKSLHGAAAVLLLFGLIGTWTPSLRADENPVAQPQDVQTLTVNKDVPSGNVVLNWTDGTAPFS